MREHVFVNTMIDRLPSHSMTAAMILNKGVVCPKLDIVLIKSR